MTRILEQCNGTIKDGLCMKCFNRAATSSSICIQMYEVEDKKVPVESIEEQMNRPRFELHPAFSEDEYIFVSTLWKIYKSNPGTDGKKMAVAELRQYISQERNRAILECISRVKNQLLSRSDTNNLVAELEKLKK